MLIKKMMDFYLEGQEENELKLQSSLELHYKKIFWEKIHYIMHEMIPKLHEEIRIFEKDYNDTDYALGLYKEINELLSNELSERNSPNINHWFEQLLIEISKQHISKKNITKKFFDFTIQLTTKFEFSEKDVRDVKTNLIVKLNTFYYELHSMKKVDNYYSAIVSKNSLNWLIKLITNKLNEIEENLDIVAIKSEKSEEIETIDSEKVLKRFKYGELKKKCKIIALEYDLRVGETLSQSQIDLVISSLEKQGYNVNSGSVASTLKDKLNYRKKKKGY
ncbi:MAG: hypothetical protein KKB34_12635 [Bacteroidetes bacterium]|nr:hypothetical protein [Bacteroidota bacterium]